jgi:hypothetical protein
MGESESNFGGRNPAARRREMTTFRAEGLKAIVDGRERFLKKLQEQIEEISLELEYLQLKPKIEQAKEEKRLCLANLRELMQREEWRKQNQETPQPTRRLTLDDLPVFFGD